MCFKLNAVEFKQIELNDDTYMIVDINLGNDISLLKGTEVFLHETEYMFPLYSIVDSLQFETIVDLNELTFSYVSQTTPLDINFTQGNISEEANLEDGYELTWATNGFDIYVTQDFIELLLQVKIEDNVSNLRFSISTSIEGYLFPAEVIIQRQIENKSKIKRTIREAKTPEIGQIFIEDQYRFMQAPQISLGVNAVTGNNLVNSNDYAYNATVSGVSDLFYHSSQYSIASTNEGGVKSNIRFSRFKSSPFDILPGNVDYYSYGDISAPGTALASGGGQGVGIQFSQKQERFGSQFGVTEIDGIATPGWEVEIYDGSFFIDNTIVGEDGRYVFNDIDTRYGINQYRIELFGPYGEKETRYETVQIGQNWLQPSQFSFQGALLDKNRSLLNSEQYNDNYELKPDVFSFAVDYGLNETTQLQLLVSQQPGLLQEKNDYISAQTQTVFDSSTLKVSVAAQSGAGGATDISWFSVFGDLNTYAFNFQHIDNYDGLNKESVNNYTSLSGSVSSKFDFFGPKSFGFSGNYINDNNLLESYSANGRLSFNLFGLGILTKLNYINNVNKRDIFERETESLSFGIGASGKAAGGRLSLSAGGNVNIGGVSQIGVGYQKKFENNISFSSQLNYQISKTQSDSWGVSNSFAMPTPFSMLTASLSYDSKQQWQVSVGTNISFGYNAQQRSLEFGAFGNGGATLDLGAYLDRNNNKMLDEGDLAIDGAVFGPLPSWQQRQTSNNGRTWLTGVPANTIFNLKGKWLDGIVPSQGDHSIYTHPGAYIVADIPFTITTSIAGYVILQRGDILQGVYDVRVKLIELKSGRTVSTIRTDEDGYFEFYQHLPGRYRIEPVNEDIANRGMVFSHRAFELVTPEYGGYIELGSFYVENGKVQNNVIKSVAINDYNYEPLIYDDALREKVYVRVAGKESDSSQIPLVKRNESIDIDSVKGIKRANIKVVSPDGTTSSKVELQEKESFSRLELRYIAQLGAYSAKASAVAFKFKVVETSNMTDADLFVLYDEEKKLYRLVLGEMSTSEDEIKEKLITYKQQLPSIEVFVSSFKARIEY